MKRLVYSPKVYVFIRSRIRNGQIFDVSDYVTSGSVSRNINAPSTAEFTLKNRFFQFSANKDEPIFMPMDGVTIWMQRIAGRPIQVFTGYLDSVPYYQMYPADAPFTATCTLKRLKHTYFDPGVKATMDFFSKRGWTLTPDGNVANFRELLRFGTNVNDGGLGVLLQDFMKEIAGWDPTAIMVSDIPRDLPARAARLYSQLQAGAEVQRTSLENILKGLVSLKANNMLGSTGAPAVDNVKKIMEVAADENVDMWLMVMSALVLSGLRPDHAEEDETAPNYGYGLFALAPEIGAVAGTQGQSGERRDTIEGYSLVAANNSSIFKVANSVRAYLKRIRRNAPNAQLRLDWRTQPYQKIAELIAAASGKNVHKELIQAAIETNANLVQQYLGAAGNVDYDEYTVSNERPFAYWNIDTASLDWNVTWDDLKDRMDPNHWSEDERRVLDTTSYQKLAQNYNRAAAYAWVGMQPEYNLKPVELQSRSDTVLVMGHRASSHTTTAAGFYAWAASQTTNRGKIEVWYRAAPSNAAADNITFKYSVNGKQYSYTSDRDVPSAQRLPDIWFEDTNTMFVVIRMTDDNNPIDPPYYDGHPIFSNTATPTSQENEERQLHFSDLLKINFATAFTTQFTFPANFLESQILSGERSLMNDISVLEGVDRLCKASMRSYMSLPSGEFLAFFPDYFGSFDRRPYWKVLDTEIMNLGINLTDANLVTHAFVTGGTFAPGEINFINKALSLGVVSIEQVFNDEDFISGGAAYFAGGVKRTANDVIQAIGNHQKRGVDNQASIQAFLGTYGLRPMSVENPIIRSQVVEFLYAWQLFMYQWAAQFATRAEFTFMPELMAGGRIALPDHDLELYLESVSHSWSYADGFTTSATVMAPQSTKPDKWPGMAMASGLSGFGAVSTGGIG